jgi:inner membrane transporter RhtA
LLTGRVRRRPPAPLLVLGSITSVQCGAALATRLFPVAGPGGTVFLRLAFAAVLLLVATRPSLRLDRAEWGWLVLFGAVFAAMNTSFYEAIARLPLGLAVTIEFVGPLAVAVTTSRTRLDLLWAALAGGGVVALTTGGGRTNALGVLLALAAGACWGCYILINQQVGRRFAGQRGLAVALVVGTLLTAPLGIVQGGRRLLRAGVLGRGLAVGLLASAVPYSLEVAALRRLRTAVFGVLMSLEPAVAAMVGLAFLGQHLSVRDWLAIVAVTAASVGATGTGPRRGQPALVENHPSASLTSSMTPSTWRGGSACDGSPGSVSR